MLRETEKKRIREEEIFRNEVKSSITKPALKPNRLWTFLNSVLGIWFLSTILIGGFTFAYNDYQEAQKRTVQRKTQIRHLNLEIESRISQFWTHIDPIVLHEERDSFKLKPGIKYDTIVHLWIAFKNPPAFNPKLTTTIYKEFDSRTTISLMFELAELQREEYGLDKEDFIDKLPEGLVNLTHLTRKDHSEEIEEVEEIEKAAKFIGSDLILDTENPTPVPKIWENFSDVIIRGQWGSRFPYTDCLLC